LTCDNFYEKKQKKLPAQGYEGVMSGPSLKLFVKRKKTVHLRRRGYDSLMAKLDNWLWDVSLNDEKAFRDMFERYYANLCIYAKRFIQDLHTREDIIQDVFCAIWINREKINHTMPITNYLVTCVKHHCLNYLRRNDKYAFDEGLEPEKIPVYAEGEENMFFLHELEDMFNRTLAGLPEEYRIAFEMSRLENKPSGEIAEKLGVSVRTVERYRNKAIEILKTELKDYLPLLCLFLHVRL
jgi:RNA polymerase sigma-70 factor (ECF subfamily)